MRTELFLAGVLTVGLFVPTITAQTDLPPAVEEALQLLDAGRAADAVTKLEPLAGADTPAPILALLGMAYLEAGRPTQALEVLGPLVATDNADPAVLYNAGRAALAAGSPEAAEGYWKRSLSLVDASPAARELGMLYGASGRYHEALSLLRPWIAGSPEDTEARLVGAFCAVQLERAPDAEELLSDLPQDQPRVRLLWAKVLMLKGDPFGAIGSLEPLLADPPADLASDLKRTAAEAYVTVGQGAEAARILDGLDAKDPRVALQLARARYQSGDLDGALETLAAPSARALAAGEAMPREAAAIVLEQGRLLVAAGRHADAVPYLEAATRALPEDKQGWQSLGQALAAVGRRDEAQAALERFRDITHSEIPASVKDMQLERDVDDPTGRELREAMRLLSEDRTEEALLIARREASVAPQDPRPRLLESRTLLYLERPEEALEAAEAVLRQNPENADGHYQKGVVRMALGQADEAESDLRTAIELAPDHTAAMNDLAVLLMQKNELGEARTLLERVLELRPEDKLAAMNLERMAQ